MTDKQPEALRMADELESCGCLADEAIYDNAAAELRRLHAVEQQRDELLQALKWCLEKGSRWHPCDPTVVAARSAIAKATGATQ